MFENLVESGSHSADMKRKGSFLAAFGLVYLVLIVAGIVVAIIMAPAIIDQQNLELTALIAPVPVPQQQQQKQEAPKPEKMDISKNVDVRKELIADVTRTDLVPKEISAKASDIPPVRKGVVTMLGSGNQNAAAPMAPGNGTGSIVSNAPAKVEIKDEPCPCFGSGRRAGIDRREWQRRCRACNFGPPVAARCGRQRSSFIEIYAYKTFRAAGES